MQRAVRSAPRAIAAGLAALISLAPVRAAHAGFIDLGSADFFELVGIDVTVANQQVYASQLVGSSPDLPETVSDSYSGFGGTANVVATTAAGTPGVAPSLDLSANATDSASVEAIASVSFEATLIKLHPDAPDDIPIPILFSSTLSGIAQLDIGQNGASLISEQALGGDLVVDSTLFVLPLEGLGISISASTGGLVGGDPSISGSATGPVFAIDPDFRVPFGTAEDPTRTELAVDLYSLAYPGAIGFAGDFTTVTPLDDGCLPDPGIPAPGGGPSAVSGGTVTCKKVDPSGFRTYDAIGPIDDLHIAVESGATVRSDVDGNVDPDNAVTFGLLGEGHTLVNDGEIVAFGEASNAIFVGGDAFDLTNRGRIASEGDESETVWVVGDEAGIVNQGRIESEGFLSSAVVVEGDGAFVSNEGEVATSGHVSSGIVVEGDFATLENDGSVSTQGAYSAGIVVLGNDSLATLENRGAIDTLGDDAWGMLVLGQDHDILNADAPGGGGVISTAGDRAHGIALGLQEAVIPPGIGIPPSAFDPASGSVTNDGSISTLGAEADAIHVFGNDVSVTNRGTLLPLGDGSSGIDVKGTQLTVANEGSILAGLVDSEDVTGIRLVDATDAEVHNADDAEIRVGGDFASGVAGNGLLRVTLDNLGTVQADGADAAGVDLAGQDLQIDNGSDMDTGEVAAIGERAIGIRAQGERIQATNHFQGSLGVEGVDGVGLRLRGSDLFASNEGGVTVGANAAWGVLVEADASGAYLAENRGSIAIQGGGGPATALALHNTSGAPLSLTDDIGMSVCGGSPQGAGVINCGGIGLQRDAATGVSAEGISGSLIENFGTISGSGDDLTGIRVRQGVAGASDDFVTNFRDILLNGSGATGMSVQGDENTIVNGTGSIVIFPDEALPGDPFTTISAQIDIVASVEGKEVEDLPIGRIAVDGPDAVGIDVAGDDNTIAILGALGDELNSVVASGTGSVGIRLSGARNRVINNGRIAGTAASVLGGAGSDIVVNGATLEGDVRLQGGDDTFQIEPGSGAVEAISVAGMVDGGTGIDTLAVRARDDGTLGPALDLPVDGSQFVGFENLTKDGAGLMTLTGNLSLGADAPSLALIEEGGLLLDHATLSADVINVFGPAAVAGNGTLAGTVLLSDGATLSLGSSIGAITVDGDLELQDSRLEIELSGSGPGEYDVLEVLGSVSFVNSDLMVSFTDGFLPTLGESVDFLLAQQVLGLGSLSLQLAGLPAGYAFDLVTSGTGLSLVTSSVPEPSAITLVAVGLAGMGVTRRRRRYPRLRACGSTASRATRNPRS